MAYLQISDGTLRGSIITLTDKITIGRAVDNLLYINDPGISRRHAEIWRRKDCYTLIDLGSVNGSLINGKTVRRFSPYPLSNNDLIVLGNTRMIYYDQESHHHGIKEQIIDYDRRDDHESACDSSLPIELIDDKRDLPLNITLDASTVYKTHSPDESPDTFPEIIKRLEAMVDIAIDLATVLLPNKLADRIMSVIFDIFPGADRSFIMSFDKKSNLLQPLATRHRKHLHNGLKTFQVSKTILDLVVDEHRSILVPDTAEDSRFFNHQSIAEFSIRSIMCAPLAYKDEIVGVIGVDTISKLNAFSIDDLSMLTAIASQSAIAFKNAELFSTLENETKLRTQLSRYLSRDIVDGILSGIIPFNMKGEKKVGTILFSDIIGFSALASTIPAVEVLERLNRCFSFITGIITGNQGTLHKFGGDMVMAFWNVMIPDTNACYNSAKCGLEMQNALYIFNILLESEKLPPIHFGIGCNTGEFAGGNVGGADRMEYTVIGNSVNLAQRIESLASQGQIFVSSETYGTIAGNCTSVRLQPVFVKGREQPVTVYSIRGIMVENNDTMLLSIPVTIMTPEKSVLGKGIAVACTSNSTLFELHITTTIPPPSINNLHLTFNLPELSNSPNVCSTIQTAYRKTHECAAAYTVLVLTDITGDDEALLLLRNGGCIHSTKDWNAMKRH